MTGSEFRAAFKPSAILFYDSLSRLFEEGQKLGSGPVRVVSSSWRSDDQRVAVTYPTSGTTARKVLHTFDGLDRLKTVKDDGAQDPIATYLYIGKWRVDQRNMLNGVNLEVAYDTGRRVTEYKHVKNSTTVVGFGHNYNRTNNKLIQESLHDNRADERYSYDSAYRLGKPGEGNGFERGTLNTGKTAIETPTTIPGAEQKEDWNLDGVGNWKDEVFRFQGDGADTQDNRAHTSINEFYSSTIGQTTKEITHDDNGNVLDDDTKAHAHIGKHRLKHKWDFRNLLREVYDKDSEVTLGKYTYDALARRIRKVARVNGNNVTTDYLLDGNREVQERTSSGAIEQEYTFGIYIDEPLTLDKNGNADDTCIGTGDTRYYYHQNTLYSVYALTDADGGVKEAYYYDPYGRPYVITDSVNDQDNIVNFNGDDVVTKGGNSSPAVGNPFLFTGRRRDEEVYGQLFYRERYFDFTFGAFSGSDPIMSDESSYQYVRNNPIVYLDPFGLEPVNGADLSYPPGYDLSHYPLEWTSDNRSVAKKGTLYISRDTARKGGQGYVWLSILHEYVGNLMYETTDKPDYVMQHGAITGLFETQAYSNLTMLASMNLPGTGCQWLKNDPPTEYDTSKNGIIYGTMTYRAALSFVRNCCNGNLAVRGTTFFATLETRTHGSWYFAWLTNDYIRFWWGINCDCNFKITGAWKYDTWKNRGKLRRSPPWDDPSWWIYGLSKEVWGDYTNGGWAIWKLDECVLCEKRGIISSGRDKGQWGVPTSHVYQ